MPQQEGCPRADPFGNEDLREFLGTVQQSARLGKTVLKNKIKALLGALAMVAAPWAHSQGAPFVCDATAYSIATGQLATASYSTTTGIVSAEIPLGTPWTSGVAPALNSLGYNYQDNYLYAVARSSDGTGVQQLVRIGSAGAGAGVGADVGVGAAGVATAGAAAAFASAAASALREVLI